MKDVPDFSDWDTEDLHRDEVKASYSDMMACKYVYDLVMSCRSLRLPVEQSEERMCTQDWEATMDTWGSVVEAMVWKRSSTKKTGIRAAYGIQTMLKRVSQTS